MALSERARESYARRTRERRESRKDQWVADRDAHLAATNYRCEIGPRLAEHGIAAYRSCAGNAMTCHHALPRGMGGSGDNTTLLSTCSNCHEAIEANPQMAETVGAKVRHGR